MCRLRLNETSPYGLGITDELDLRRVVGSALMAESLETVKGLFGSFWNDY
jgi:hypothetical protein